LQIRNGSGLRFDVYSSRGFDIGLCELFSVPVSWRAHTGHVSPFTYDASGTGWNRGFQGGLLTTCGLQQAGQPCIDGDEALGQHGRVSYIPAEIIAAEITREPEPKILLRAKICETKAAGNTLTLYRCITTYLFQNKIEIQDEVVNEAYTDAPFLILYHVNFGFPLISPTSYIEPFESKRELIKGNASLDSCLKVPPAGDSEPDVILHTNIKNKKETMDIHICNEIEFNARKHILHVFFAYKTAQCPYLTQWRCQQKGVNVFAFEPGNVSTRGRAFQRQNGTLIILKPGESKKYDLSLSFKMEYQE
jgi:galactose mutarotase-like enzyme